MTAVGQIRRIIGSDAGAECTSAVDDTSETLTDMAGDLMVIPPLLVRHEKKISRERADICDTRHKIRDSRPRPFDTDAPFSAKASFSAVFGNTDPRAAAGGS